VIAGCYATVHPLITVFSKAPPVYPIHNLKSHIILCIPFIWHAGHIATGILVVILIVHEWSRTGLTAPVLSGILIHFIMSDCKSEYYATSSVGKWDFPKRFASGIHDVLVELPEQCFKRRFKTRRAAVDHIQAFLTRQLIHLFHRQLGIFAASYA